MIRAINRLVMIAGITIVPIGIGLFYQSFKLQGLGFTDSVTGMVAALIGMIPEGIYLLVSIALAISATRLAGKKVMLHDMKSTETLAREDVLCVDKTGTVTDNSMLVTDVVTSEGISQEDAENYKKLMGDYIRALPDNNISMDALRSYFKEGNGKNSTDIFPFSSKYKYSSVGFGDDVYLLGAPEFVLRGEYEKHSAKIEEFAKKGYRVLVFGKYSENIVPKGGINAPVTPIFYLCLQNPIRENAKDTFAYFKKQGVEIKVISGDNPITVSRVASEAGIEGAENYVDMTTLNSDAAIEEAAVKYTVYGRTSPEAKQKLVKALKRAGRTVAMTGDGVNDILAMRSADCSIAMASGADAAKNISHIILIDFNFARLPAVVEEGRRVVNNLQRTASLFVTKTIFAFVMTLIFTLASIIEKDPSIQYPFITNHLYLWEIVTSGMAAFFLALERNSEKIEGKFLANVFKKAIPAASILLGSVLLIFLFYLLQKNGATNLGIYSNNTAVAMSVITFSILGTVCLYKVCSPLNKYRSIVLICSASVNVVALIVTAIVSYATNKTEPVLQIPYLDLSGPAFLVTMIIIVVFASLYLFVYRIIDIKKGVDSDNEN